MYTAKELQMRASPSEWRIVSNNGTTIVAINNITNESFTGTGAAFQAMLSSISPGFAEMLFRADGTFGGFRNSSGVQLEVPTTPSNSWDDSKLTVSRWVGASPVGPVTRTSVNDTTDDEDLIMASFVIPPASVSGLRVGSVVELFGLWDVTSSATSKSLRINYTAGAVGPVTFSSTSATTNIGNGQRFQVHVKDVNTVTFLAVASASGAGASSAAIGTQNSPNVLDTGFTMSFVARWTAGFVTDSETIVLQHAKALFTP